MLDLNPSQNVKILTHERFQDQQSEILRHLEKENLEDHIVILSSGTTSATLKGYALSRSALMANAQAVNEHFNLTSQDVWGLSLPEFHVGGLSVLCRAHLLGNKVVTFGKWDPQEWTRTIAKENVSITTVVPTQVFDLVQAGIHAPSCLRYIIVGGDLLSDALADRAIKLGWPVIRTFGMTEVCSQMASGQIPGEKDIRVLNIHQVKTNTQGRLLVKSPALFTLEFAMEKNFRISKAVDLCDSDGFFSTQDRATINGLVLMHEGRLDDQIKIAGRLVSLLSLKKILADFAIENGLQNKVEIDLVSDDRLGKRLRLLYVAGVGSELRETIKALFSPVTVSLEKEVESFERTDLGKLKRQN